jgi:hypothetical protein
MIQPQSNFVQPTEEEWASARLTSFNIRAETTKVKDRLVVTSRLLQSVDPPPEEAALLFLPAGASRGRAVKLGSGLIIGRGREATLCLEDCAGLSRKHFGIRPEAGEWLLEDLGSHNGTAVDGVEDFIKRRILRDGDIILAGDMLFLFVNPLA